MDLTDDDVAQPGVGVGGNMINSIVVNNVEVKYANLMRNSCCYCYSEIRTGKVQICVTICRTPSTVKEKMYFHTACLNSPFYKSLNIFYSSIKGTHILAEKDLNALRLVATNV